MRWPKIILGGLMLAGLLGFPYLLDFATAPWAYVGGGPVGWWKGKVVLPKVGGVDVVFALKHEVYREEGPELEGTVWHCGVAEKLREGPVSGRVSWRGEAVELRDGSVYGDLGSPERLECQRVGEDLRCVVDFRRPTTEKMTELAKKAGIWEERKPVTFVLERVGEGARPGCGG